MNTLTPAEITLINPNSEGMVCARKLHEFLEVKTRFNDWFNRRIEEYGFTQGTDFILLKNEYNDIERLDLSISCAKELCMVERNDRGKEARLYFIECEKIAKASVAPAIQPQVTVHPEVQKAEDAQAYIKAYIGIGALLEASPSLTRAMAVQGANREIGFDCKGLLAGNVSDVQDALLTPTDIGSFLTREDGNPMTAREVNNILCKLGFQSKHRRNDKLYYLITEAGKGYGSYLDVGKRHSDGTPIKQIKWFKEKTIGAIEKYVN